MLPHRSETQTSLVLPADIPLPSSPIGVYIHVPFCRKACHYCDFYFSVQYSWMEAYTEALLQEIKAWTPWLMAQPVRTVYLGGGTPSWLSPSLLQKILHTLQKHSHWQPVEVTLETNPEDVTQENLSLWRELGINRLSLGVQSLSDEILQLLGRKASATLTRSAIETIISHGWKNWSVDIIFAVPGQTISCIANDLRYLVEKARVPHISLYGLTIEPRTVLYKKYRRGEFAGINDEAYAEMYLFIHDFLADYGYEHYEISNWGRNGFHSRHNLGYWEGRPYVGLGPSAHSYIWPYRWWNKSNLRTYIEHLGEKQKWAVDIEKIGEKESILEWFMLNFRLSKEINWDKIPLSSEILSIFGQHAREWAERGWIEISARGLRILPPGWLWLNTLLRKVLDLLDYAT